MIAGDDGGGWPAEQFPFVVFGLADAHSGDDSDDGDAGGGKKQKIDDDSI